MDYVCNRCLFSIPSKLTYDWMSNTEIFFCPPESYYENHRTVKWTRIFVFSFGTDRRRYIFGLGAILEPLTFRTDLDNVNILVLRPFQL